MGRSPCCDGIGLKRGPWTPEEDQKLFAYIQENGHGSWRTLPQKAGLRRCGKSCRLRWINYLKPDIKRGKFTTYEEQTMIQLHALLGNRWSIIAAHLPNRTDNEIKNYWNTHLKKKLSKMGIDPVTHKRNYTLYSTDKAMNMSEIHHKAQWESTRLEAEARLAKESNLRLQNALRSSPYHHHDQSNNIELRVKPSFDILKAWQSGYGGNTTNAPPYTLSFLESAVEMLASRPSSNDFLRTNSKLINTDAMAYGNIEGDLGLADLSNSMIIDWVNPGVTTEPEKVYRKDSSSSQDGQEWNIEEESYWNDIFNNPETLYSVVC